MNHYSIVCREVANSLTREGLVVYEAVERLQLDKHDGQGVSVQDILDDQAGVVTP
jgi:hypothetical protein